MKHSLVKVREFQVVSPYTIKLVFEDDVSQVIDFKPVLNGPLFGPLLDPSMFLGVKLDPIAGTLVWPNGADFDPDTLYHWPEIADQFAEQLSK